MRFSNIRLPTRLSPDELEKRNNYRRSMKIAFLTISPLTVVVLAVAIYLLVGPGLENV